jgi:hypothetical protein
MRRRGSEGIEGAAEAEAAPCAGTGSVWPGPPGALACALELEWLRGFAIHAW